MKSFPFKLEKKVEQKTNSLFHNTTLDGHQGVVDLDKVILAVLFQVHRVKVELDYIVDVCSKLPLHEGVGGVRSVREAGRLDLPDVVCLRMF